MRTVLVTQRLEENEAYPETREGLDVRWARVFRELDLLPIPMATEIDPSAYAELRPVGVVLTGGNDLSSCTSTPPSRLRDAYERRVLATAKLHDWPIFAVCRGLQLLASEGGAELVRHHGHVATEHALHVDREAPFSDLLANVQAVNSFHTYAPRAIEAPGWRVCARAVDGAVEALANEDRRILGVMWHPERYDRPRACDLALIRAVLAI